MSSPCLWLWKTQVGHSGRDGKRREDPWEFSLGSGGVKTLAYPHGATARCSSTQEGRRAPWPVTVAREPRPLTLCADAWLLRRDQSCGVDDGKPGGRGLMSRPSWGHDLWKGISPQGQRTGTPEGVSNVRSKDRSRAFAAQGPLRMTFGKAWGSEHSYFSFNTAGNMLTVSMPLNFPRSWFSTVG